MADKQRFAEIEKHIGKANFELYSAWRLDEQERESNQFFRRYTKDDFTQELLSLNYDDPTSIEAFHDFLNRPKVEPIIIGNIGDVAFQLCPEPGQLSAIPFAEKEDDIDDRTLVADSILGVYTSSSTRRQGFSGEGEEQISGGSTIDTSSTSTSRRSDPTHSTRASTVGSPSRHSATATQPRRVEVFQQLGLLYSRNKAHLGDHRKAEGWDATQYVLVVNVEDDSVWVVCKQFIMDEHTAEYISAREKFPAYASFPGIGEDQGNRVVLARLADNWTSLNPDVHTKLNLRMCTYYASNKPEPVLVYARRTAQGGIRRTRD